jgi:hypothetical protein
VPETCWASNKICNKNSSVASSWHFISTYYRRWTVKTTSNFCHYFPVLLYWREILSVQGNNIDCECLRMKYCREYLEVNEKKRESCRRRKFNSV